jgi:hypothetical protein
MQMEKNDSYQGIALAMFAAEFRSTAGRYGMP